jgi:hypothetical protein
VATPILGNLILAFQAAERKESVAALLDAESFDLDAIRVLSAWAHSDHKWTMPARKCPDDGKPTMRAWAWMVGGMNLDYIAIADAAGVSHATARSKLAVLLGHQLIYPDGQMAQVARAALQATITRRVRGARAAVKPKTDEAN